MIRRCGDRLAGKAGACAAETGARAPGNHSPRRTALPHLAVLCCAVPWLSVLRAYPRDFAILSELSCLLCNPCMCVMQCHSLQEIVDRKTARQTTSS